ncbi:unnamed protein product [Cuscuta europaea]|uniref:DEAD-box ATP-dependent RNA helicase 33 n=1 Tax=Cuscuta europaea TaxID=41803 RepID=A0A9P0ZG80_CUSEU|nr:unnamed protein product [Cuscuta europaea]
MVLLPSALSGTPINHPLSSSVSPLSPTRLFFLHIEFSRLGLTAANKPTTVCMGGGPRTFPGGVTKWQWKRMQAKKSKQLLKARLARERQIYEMRKRAELKAAISELERPWEAVEKAPTLFSVSADEQLRVLADRFQKPRGFDLWSEKDGPQLFKFQSESSPNRGGIATGRFESCVNSDPELLSADTWGANKTAFHPNSSRTKSRGRTNNYLNRKGSDIRSGEQDLKRISAADDQADADFKNNPRKGNRSRARGVHRKRIGKMLNNSNRAAFDMSLQSDGRYELEAEN